MNTRSSWFGLWNNNEKHYAVSSSININDIKKFINNDTFRIILKKNKFYKKDTNRPLYCFAIGNTFDSANSEISYKEMRCNYLEKQLCSFNDEQMAEFIEENYGIRLFTYSECKRIMNGALADGHSGYSYGDTLIEDYL